MLHDLQGLIPEYVHDPLGKGGANAGNGAGGQVLPDILRRTGQLSLTIGCLELCAELAVGDILPLHQKGLSVFDLSQLPHYGFYGLIRFQLQNNISVLFIKEQNLIHNTL